MRTDYRGRTTVILRFWDIDIVRVGLRGYIFIEWSRVAEKVQAYRISNIGAVKYPTSAMLNLVNG